MEEATGNIKFLFTKLHKDDVGDYNTLSTKDKKECKKKLKQNLKEIKDCLNDDDKLDVDFVGLLDHMISSVKKLDNMIVIDPLDNEVDIQAIFDDLLNESTFMEPENAFNTTISDKS